MVYKLEMMFLPQFGTKLENGEIAEGKFILRADERLAKEVGESRNQIARYIRLTNLIPKILEMVDAGRIAFTIGVELIETLVKEWYEKQMMQAKPSVQQKLKKTGRER